MSIDPPEPIAIVTAEAVVQNTAPPRIQVTVTGMTDLGTNLLTNPSFEDGTDGWTGVFDLWTGDEEPLMLAPTDGTLYAHAHLTTTTRTLIAEQVAPVTPGTLTVSVDAAAGAENGTLELDVVATTAGTPTGDVVSDAVDAVDTWQTLEAEYDVPAGADGIRVQLYATATTAPGVAGHEVMFDNATVLLGSAPDTVTVYRIEEDTGTRVPLRGAIDVPATSALVLIDHGAPFGEPVHYLVEGTSQDGTLTELAVTNTVQIETRLPWISDPITGQGVALTIQTWPEFTYAARRSVVPVAGRPGPVVLTDVPLLASSELVVVTRTRQQLATLRTLLAEANVLQVRPPCEAVEHQYISVGDITETRYRETGTGAGADWTRLVTLDVQAVDQPAPQIPATGDTLADLHAYVPTTLAELADAFGPDATLLTIAQTNLSLTTMIAGG